MAGKYRNKNVTWCFNRQQNAVYIKLAHRKLHYTEIVKLSKYSYLYLHSNVGSSLNNVWCKNTLLP